ncbi:MAG: recombinase family protein, partial [Proteobacteria bacterium]|nr:recombinase family protein [Pseudomonadota bacterium]
VGPPPFGYKSERLPGRKGERKVPDSEYMPALLNLLKDYASGQFSFRDVADRLNAQNFRTRTGRPFTGASIRDVLDNRFYEGKVVYHQGLPDEVVVDGTHEVTQEVTELWLKCQEIKAHRRNTAAGHPRGQARHFPFSRVLTCQRCGNPYYGEAVRSGAKEELRLSHERRGSGRNCSARPRSRSVSALMDQMADRVMPYLKLDTSWKARVIAVLREEEPQEHDQSQQDRLQRALDNLRKQHKWSDLSDQQYRREREPLRLLLRGTYRRATPGDRKSALQKPP